MASIRSKVDMLTKNREQGTLHHQQCIDELTSQLDARNIRVKNTSIDDSKIVSPTRSETPTSFVTVIEVKDPTPMPTTNATVTQPTSISIANNSVDDMKPEPSYSPPQLPQKQDASGDDNHSIVSSASTTTTTTVTAASTAAPIKCDESAMQSSQMIEVKRKIPPRFVLSSIFRFVITLDNYRIVFVFVVVDILDRHQKQHVALDQWPIHHRSAKRHHRHPIHSQAAPAMCRCARSNRM